MSTNKALRTGSWLLAVSFLFLLFASAAPASSPRYGETYCDRPDFHCITVGTHEIEKKSRSGNGHKPRKIVVRDTWQNLFPDENEREIVMRINRMNIRLRKGMVIAVPNDMKGKTYMDFSPFPGYIEHECEPFGEQACRVMCEDCGEGKDPKFKLVCERACIPREELHCAPDGSAIGEKVIIVDLKQLAFAAYDETGKLLKWGPISAGTRWNPTRVGTFKITRKYGRWAKSRLYPPAKDDKPAGGAPVPYFMRFARGYGIHHYYEVPGRHASHGCVRVFFDDAKWLNREFAIIGTKVIVRPYK